MEQLIEVYSTLLFLFWETDTYLAFRLITAKTCSALTRTEDFPCSLRLIWALERLELFLLWLGRRFIL